MITLIRSDELQDFITNNKLAIIDVFAEWCKPCQRMLTILPNMMQQLEGKAVMAKLNVDSMGEMKQRYEIKVVPTFLFFLDGKLVTRFDGVTTLAQLKQTAEHWVVYSRNKIMAGLNIEETTENAQS